MRGGDNFALSRGVNATYDPVKYTKSAFVVCTFMSGGNPAVKALKSDRTSPISICFRRTKHIRSVLGLLNGPKPHVCMDGIS